MPIRSWRQFKILQSQWLCSSLTNDVCVALPFCHAFMGCDTTSSFYNQVNSTFLMFG